MKFCNRNNYDMNDEIILFQGLYYSYFKTLIEAESTWSGLKGLYANNLTEYPKTINVLQRFNVYPELFIGLTYRLWCPQCSDC